jgi:hypothetical protein
MNYKIKVHNVIYFDSSTSFFASYLEDLSKIRASFEKTHPYNDLAKRLGFIWSICYEKRK